MALLHAHETRELRSGGQSREAATIAANDTLPSFEAGAPRPLERIGPYRVLQRLGGGAMGEVYRAEHAVLGRQVALKVLRPQLAGDASCCQRFTTEARAVSLICNDHLVEIIDHRCDEEGFTYLVMELLDGEDLASLRQRQRIDSLRSLRLARQLSEVLEHVHDAGIVHRDLKPDNLFIVHRDGEDFLKLLDFGVAKVLTDGRDSGSLATLPGMVVGTPHYMAPEQAAGDPVDHRSDLYAVGVILFELLCDRLPLRARTLRELLADVVVKPPPLVSECVELPAALSAPVDRIVGRCLCKNPAQRPQSARQLASWLDDAIRLAEALDPPAAVPRPRDRAARERGRLEDEDCSHQAITLPVGTTLVAARRRVSGPLEFLLRTCRRVSATLACAGSLRSGPPI